MTGKVMAPNVGSDGATIGRAVENPAPSHSPADRLAQIVVRPNTKAKAPAANH
jgi:hypothetical protein